MVNPHAPHATGGVHFSAQQAIWDETAPHQASPPSLRDKNLTELLRAVISLLSRQAVRVQIDWADEEEPPLKRWRPVK
jgi:hypothetical protein